MELLRLLARQRLLKVGEKGIMTIGTKEAVEREANNLALLLQKYKLDPSSFSDIGSLRRTIRGLEELDLANVLKAKAPPPDNVIEGKFGKSFSEEIKDIEKGKVKLFGDESQVELAYISKFNKHPRDVIVPNLPKRPANYNELSLDDRRMIDLEAENIYKEELKESIFLEDSMKKNIAEATKKGDFTGIANQVLRDKDIMREFMLSKKFPFSGEDAIPLARKAKFDEETKQMGISLTPGKDAKNTVDEFVNQMKRFKVSDKDIQSMLKSGKSGQVDYVMEQYGLSASDVADILKRGKPLIEGMASGGRAELKGGGEALKALLRFLSAQSGKTGSQGLADINPKKFGEALNFMIGKEQMAVLQGYRKEYLESLLDTIKSDKKLLDDIKTKYPKDVQPMIYKMANEGGNKGRLDVYNKIDIDEAITDIETMVKNMELAGGRKLNSDGGRIGLKEGYRPGAPIDPLDPQRKISEVMDAYDKYYKGPGKKVRKIPFIKFFQIYAKENFADGGRTGFRIGSSKKTATGDYEGFDLSYLKDLSPEVQKAFLRRLYTGNMTKQADGGRVGLKLGSISKRNFLKMLAALGITGAAAKSGIVSLGGKQSGKQVVKEIIKTPNVAGKPEWFDSLVNKVIAEGVDKTDDLAYKERMIVHTKKINPNEEVAVYQDLDDGSVRINVGGHRTDKDGNVIRAVNDPDQIDLIVRKGKTEEGGFKTKDSFEASEAEPRAVGGPEDADIEFDGIREVDNVDDLMQDVSSLEEFATGKKLTGKKAAKAKKKREDFQKFTEDNQAQAEYLEKKYGPYDDSAMDDFASGGIARMLGE